MVHRKIPLSQPVPPALVAALNGKLASCLDPAIKAGLSPGDPAALEVTYADGLDESSVLDQVREIAAAILKGARFYSSYEPEVLYENRVPAPRATPDIEALLIRRGDIILLGNGLAGFGGHFLEVMDRFDAAFRQVALAAGAQARAYPDLLPLDAAERTGYLENFLDHATFAPSLQRDIFAMNDLLSKAQRRPADYRSALDVPEHLLNPALCYNVFLHYGKLDTEVRDDQFVTVIGRCFRHEGALRHSLLRLRNFTMRELVYIGDPEAVAHWRREWIRQVFAQACKWRLSCRVLAAHDPFFVREHAARALYQLTHRIKYELVAAVPGMEEEQAISSFNWHGDHFTRAFGLTRAGQPLHSACVGFGLERWTAALLAQQGPDALPE